jgi:hypothetical protein
MKLKLEDVQVDSFITVDASAEQNGTVQGYQFSVLFSCPPKYTCPECAPPAIDEPAPAE